MLFRELDAEIRKRKSSEARARSMLRTALDGVWLADDNGCLLEVNQAASTMLGYSHDEMVGLGIHRIEVLEAPEVIRDRTLRLKRRGSDLFESRHRRKDGTEFPVEVSITFLRETDQCVVFIRDITERKQMEKELRESEKRFRHVSSSMMDIAYSCLRRSGEDMAIDWMIGGTQALLGCSIERVMAARCWRNFVLEEDRPLFMEQVMSLAPGQSSDCELRLQKTDGSLVWVQCYARCEVSEEDQDYQRIFGALVDITGRKQAEEENARLQAQLQQAQKMESLGTLSGGIAHDMNNVLGAILGLASANVETQPPGSPAYRAFETIVKAATRGGEMVRSLLAFARQRKAEDRVLDMNAILQEEIHLLERTTLSRVRLEMDLAPDLQPMRGDASALNNAIMNLCVNAVDAMSENGTLTLRTRNVDNDWIEVVVEDTGTGMPKDILDRAMEPFYTTKGVGKGTGLGLSMVYSTVKAHSGQIEIHSMSGQGTQVRMRFPACASATEAVNPNAGAGAETGKLALRVLLVDDDELIQSSMEAILQALGHAATIVSSGEAALAVIEGGFEPDVVILDMNMPGLGGSGTLPGIRVLLPHVPILLSTGRADQVALDLAAAHLHVTLLPKPFNIKELKKHLAPFGEIRS
jgi:PAS domain S-box-containing protein